jgi:predicted amidohydrolase YtcJ
MAELLVTALAILDAGGRLGDALLIEDDTLIAVGETARLRRPGLAERALPGFIVPGLRDAHFHPVGHAAALQRLSLAGAADFRTIVEALREAGAAQPPGTALVAMRLDDEALSEGHLPDRHLLDRALPGRPVLLVRHCGHIAVASTAALSAAGIGTDFPDPPGGSVDRDDTGTPTGVLRETAIAPVAASLRSRQAPLSPHHLADAVASLAGVGLTGLGAIVSLDEGLWGAGTSELDLILQAAPQLALPLRVMVVADSPAALEAAARRLQGAGPTVSFLGLKVFADGSLGGHTAALRRPYADRPDLTGTHRLDPVWAEEMIRAAASLGGTTAVHAIGDAALDRVLDAMEKALSAGTDPSLLRVEHVSLATAEDCRRLAALGVTACIQPSFLPSDSPWLEARLGPERLAAVYPFRSLADAGVPLAGGSDCPVEPPHPLWGMAAARDRAGFLPEQALTPAEALDLFTAGAARAINEDARLAPGRPATFTVLAGDPVAADPASLRDMTVLATFVGGREVVPPAGVAPWRG